MMMATTQSGQGSGTTQSTRDQIRQQVQEQVRAQVAEAQARVRAAQAEIDAAQAAARAEAAARANARVEQVITTPPTAPTPPLPPLEPLGPLGQGTYIELPSGRFGPADIPPRTQEVVMMFFATMALIVIGLPIARAISRWIDRRSNAPAIQTADIQPQLVRIEQAVEAMAIEVERISEAQRYLTKLQTGAHADPLLVPRNQEL
jgi:hypothetical protein